MADSKDKYDIYQFNFKVLNKKVTQHEKISNIIFDGVLQIDDKNIILSTYKLYITENTSGDYSIESHFSNEYIVFSKKYNSDVSPLDLEFLPETSFVSGTPPAFSLKVPPHRTLCSQLNGFILNPNA